MGCGDAVEFGFVQAKHAGCGGGAVDIGTTDVDGVAAGGLDSDCARRAGVQVGCVVDGQGVGVQVDCVAR